MSRACSPGPEPGTVLPGSQLLQCGRRGARGGGAAAGASPAWHRLSGCSPRPRTRGLQSPGGTGPARRALRATATPWKAWALRPQVSRALGRRPAPAVAGAPAQRKAECDRRPSRSAKKSCSLWGLDEGPAGQEGGVCVEQTWARQGSHTRRGLRKLRKREAAAPSGSSRGGSERPEAERARKWGRARAGPSQRHPDRGKGAWKVLGRTPQPPGGTGSAAPLRPAVAPGDPLAELRPRGGGHAGPTGCRGRRVARTVGLAGQRGQRGRRPPPFAGEGAEQRSAPKAGRAPHGRRRWWRWRARRAVCRQEQRRARVRVQSGRSPETSKSWPARGHVPTKSCKQTTEKHYF